MSRYILFLFFFFAITVPFNQLLAQWQQTTAPQDPSGVYALSYHANQLYAGISSHGVYISTDQGMSWTEKNDGLFNLSIRDFAFIDDNIFVATVGGGVFRSSKSDTSWTSASSGLSDLGVYALTVKGTKLFAGSADNLQAGVYMSIDSANSWVKASNGLTLPASIKALASDDGQYLYTGVYGNEDGSGVFYSIDDGSMWMEANNGISNRYVWKLQIKGDNVFAGMDNGGGVYLSTNQGAMWQPVNSGLTDSIIQSFTVYGENIFVGTHTGGVFLSTNNGTNWEAINTGLTNLDIKSLAVDETYIYAGAAGSGVGENGVWRRALSEINIIPIPVELSSFTASTSKYSVTLNWTTATELNNLGFEIQRLSIEDVWEKIVFVDGYGTTTEIHNYSYVDANLTPAKYLYRLKQIDFDGQYEYSDEIEVEVNGPLTFALGQNYPNPFNPATKITYTLPQKNYVALKIYDVLGKEVATLVNEEKPTGIYEVEFNAAKLPSGIYFYRIQAGNFVETKKMVVMK